MSHFAVYVFHKKDGRGVDEILAPFDENIEFDPYVEYTREQAIANVRKEIEDYKNGPYAEFLKNPEKYKADHSYSPEHINYIENEFPKKFEWTDEQCYEDQASWYNKDRIDNNGNLLATYNPNSKWDWYGIGGRWKGGIITKDGEKVSEAYANEIDWNKTCVPFAFVTEDIEPKDAWHERGSMGWWCCVTDEKDKDDWETEFNEYISNLPDDMIVTLVDCHI